MTNHGPDDAFERDPFAPRPLGEPFATDRDAADPFARQGFGDERFAEDATVDATWGDENSGHGDSGVGNIEEENIEEEFAEDELWDDEPATAWRHKKQLIFRRGAELPHICMRTTDPQPEHRKVKRITWSPPWLFLLALANPLLFFFVGLFATRRAQVVYSLSAPSQQRRSHAILIGGLMAVVGVVLVVAGLVLSRPAAVNNINGANPGSLWLVLVILGPLLGFGGLAYAHYVAVPFRVEKIAKDYVALKDVSPEFLNLLPEWPYGAI